MLDEPFFDDLPLTAGEVEVLVSCSRCGALHRSEERLVLHPVCPSCQQDEARPGRVGRDVSTACPASG